MNTYKILSFVGLWMLTACTSDFEEMNTNPNNPDHIDQTELLLPSIMNTTARQYFDTSANRANILGDYQEDTFVSMFASAFDPTDTERYFFTALRDVQNVINQAEEKDEKHLLGIAYILKSWMFQVMTDIYGDFPYSEALKGKTDGISYPKYDTQEEIYYDILDKLKQANDLLAEETGETISKDLIYAGDVVKWQKFANSLRLRMLLRISNTTGVKVDVKGCLEEIVNHPEKYPLMESNDDNAVFTFLDEEGNQAPSYTDTPASFNESWFMTTTLATNLKELNDNRIHIYASPTRASVAEGKREFAGVPNCLTQGDEQKFNGGSTFNSTKSNLFLNRTLDPVLASPTAPQAILLTYAEVQLHLAEAKERGLISVGEAGVYYHNGIQASFEYWASRIPSNFTYPVASDVLPSSSYYEQPSVSYTGSKEEKLNKIYLQKWLALYFCGFEGWSEWRRTGVPTEISVNPPKGFHSNSSIKEWPRRVPYPMFEQTYNNENYKDAVERQGTDNLTTRVWWNK